MEKFEINKDYLYSDIEKSILANNKEVTEINWGYENKVGEGFLVIKSCINDKACSFMLTSASKNGYIYKCIYNDWRS